MWHMNSCRPAIRWSRCGRQWSCAMCRNEKLGKKLLPVKTGFLSFALVLASSSFPASAQEATPNNSQMAQAPGPLPHDPASALKFAANVNGLSGTDVKPWYLKASYQVLDPEGNPISSGTYEESWVSETKYKRSYRSDRF